MGAILNTLPLNELEPLKGTTPRRADWLTSHADATGLSVVEVKRLWDRFQQINGSADDTKLQLNDDSLPSELSHDIFVRNFLSHLPRSRVDGEAVPFSYFITSMRWLEGAELDRKLTAVYLYLNNGDPIEMDLISTLFRYMYSEMKDHEIDALAVKFMKDIGSNERGSLNRDQFVTGVKRIIPPDELEELLDFNIIPSNVVNEANHDPFAQELEAGAQNRNNYVPNDLVTSQELKQLAHQISGKNWSKLASALGFVPYDIERYRMQNNYDSTATMYELLQSWRQQQGASATKSRLKQSLQKCGFNYLISVFR